MPRITNGKPRGRPSGKTPEAVKRILEVARSGLPLKFAAQAGGIDEDTLHQWRTRYPDFAEAITQARLEAAKDRWRKIEKAAEDRLDKDGILAKAGDWKAMAWQLERSWPHDFAHPGVVMNHMTTNIQNNHFVITAVKGVEIESSLKSLEEDLGLQFSGRGLPQRTSDEGQG